jgi:uncharacterized membrane protein YeaQ/YmgE (transglycosylase-associated protein family)
VIFFVFILLLIVFVVLPIVGWALWLIITTAVVGLVIGFLARLVLPGRQPIGFFATIACGLVGSIVGGVIGRAASLGGFATVLVEIGIGAVAVALWAGARSGTVRS